MKAMSKRARIIIVLLVLLVVALVAYVAVAYAPAADERDEGSKNKNDGTVQTIRGTLDCLPHKGDGPHSMECAYGLKTEDGGYYALKQGAGATNVIEAAQELRDDVAVTGTLDTSTEGSYDIVGTLTYSKIVAD